MNEYLTPNNTSHQVDSETECLLTLRNGEVVILDKDDFEKVSQFKWNSYSGNKGGSKCIQASINGKAITLPRYILGSLESEKYSVIKYKNGDYLDCRKINFEKHLRKQKSSNTSINSNGKLLNSEEIVPSHFNKNNYHSESGSYVPKGITFPAKIKNVTCNFTNGKIISVKNIIISCRSKHEMKEQFIKAIQREMKNNINNCIISFNSVPEHSAYYMVVALYEMLYEQESNIALKIELVDFPNS